MGLRTVLVTSWPLFFGTCNAFFSANRPLLESGTLSFITSPGTNAPINHPVLPIKTGLGISPSRCTCRMAVSNNDLAEEVKTFYSPNVPLGGSTERAPRARGDDDDTSNEYSFFDEAVITVRAGSGGQGACTYRKGAGSQNGPPDGGDGGKGGNVIFRLDPALNTLAGLSQAWRPNSFGGSGAATPQRKLLPKNFRAENGQPGGRQHRSGGNGNDVVVRLPPGTLVQEKIENGQGAIDHRDIGTVNEATPEIIVARGGEGGEGTAVVFKSGRGVKRPRTAAQGGERKTIKLTLKIVADVALVGVPNAGKSTFLAAITSAKPKIANYPFTTIIPNLGVWIPVQDDDQSSSLRGAGSEGLVFCDVPGLIKGASEGVGLGHAFLRHVERCHVMVHLVDATSNDPVADYEMLNEEIVRYGGALASIPQVVVVNKVDAYKERSVGPNQWEEGLSVRVSRDELETNLKAVLPHSRLMWMSAREDDGLNDLMARLSAFVRKVKAAKEPVATD